MVIETALSYGRAVIAFINHLTVIVINSARYVACISLYASGVAIPDDIFLGSRHDKFSQLPRPQGAS